jgi:hypothetical protein
MFNTIRIRLNRVGVQFLDVKKCYRTQLDRFIVARLGLKARHRERRGTDNDHQSSSTKYRYRWDVGTQKLRTGHFHSTMGNDLNPGLESTDSLFHR